MSNDYEFELNDLTVTYEVDGYKPMINGVYITGAKIDMTADLSAQRYDEVYGAVLKDFMGRCHD